MVESSYPLSSIFKIMKPSKVDMKKASHKTKLHAAMHSKNFRWEEKLDGINVVSIGGRLFSTKLSKVTGFPSEKTHHLPQVSQALCKLGSQLILDGEVYEPGKKSNYVTSITNSHVDVALLKQKQRGKLKYFVYDMIRDIDGNWLTDESFEQRRAKLELLFEAFQGNPDFEFIVLNPIHDCLQEPPLEALEEILKSGKEGIVLKDKTKKYHPGKRPMWNWIKLKQQLEDDVFITGFAPSKKEYTGKNPQDWPYRDSEGNPVSEFWFKGLIGSVCIGKYDADGKVVDMGTVAGLTNQLREDMTKNPDQYIGEVIKIKAMEKSEHGVYRHANFVEFHPDKNAEECKLQEND